MPFFKDFIMGEKKSPRLRGDVFQVAGGAPLPPGDEPTTMVPAADSQTSAVPDAAAADASEMVSAAPAGGGDEDEAAVGESPTSSARITTTSAMTTSSAAPSPASRGSRGSRMSKLDAANEYVYGPKSEAWTRPSDAPSSVEPPDNAVRSNRAHSMRQSCILKRVRDQELERAPAEKARSAASPGSGGDDKTTDGSDAGGAVVAARVIPQTLYEKPRLTVRETKSSKFRYLFNRKPRGVTVYFKPANADARKKPPFVVALPVVS